MSTNGHGEIDQQSITSTDSLNAVQGRRKFKLPSIKCYKYDDSIKGWLNLKRIVVLVFKIQLAIHLKNN